MLINMDAVHQTYIVCGKMDLRRGIDALAAVVQEQFALYPYNQALYLFCGTRKDSFKALYWDGDGFLLLYKRIEAGPDYSGRLIKAKSES
ncbi:IS66 family insertion sequence element accessory protein TnpB [Lactiplantibacillus nangangensis]|uniref:IS66 family insertion sequence element accessory protein TnpB n=1 Tax=Lactiplantibacillus nangangensis TaxID=2559917 RepID=A0ABW1SJ00_9LACO|nr:IS66 family insertion sequence element accessory protein TnpB [Lactiplantibacillus nangangensis]